MVIGQNLPFAIIFMKNIWTKTIFLLLYIIIVDTLGETVNLIILTCIIEYNLNNFKKISIHLQ